MARPLRLEYPGALYHLTARGNARQRIFIDDQDRHKFLTLLSREIDQQRWQCHAYCLLANHYHLLIETPDGHLVAGMRRLNGVYTQTFNRRHGRVGHLFQGRYKSIVVDKESYLLELSRYVVLNPVRAKLAQEAGDWRWSSYRATAGLSKGPEWLNADWLLEQFGHRRQAAQRAYRQFVREGGGNPSPWDELRGQIWLGGERFLTRMQKKVGLKALDNVPAEQTRPSRPRPKEVMRAACRAYKIDHIQILSRRHQPAYQAAVYLLRRVCNLPLREVGQMFDISGARVSKIQEQVERGDVDSGLKKLLLVYNVNGLLPKTDLQF